MLQLMPVLFVEAELVFLRVLAVVPFQRVLVVVAVLFQRVLVVAAVLFQRVLVVAVVSFQLVFILRERNTMGQRHTKKLRETHMH